MNRPRSRENPRRLSTGYRVLATGYWLLATGYWLLLPGCATLGANRGRPLVPTLYQNRTGPYAILTNFPMPEDAPAIRHLKALDRQVQETLGLRTEAGDDPIEVYILDDREAFMHFLTFYYPELPPRRAFFLAQGPRRVVYTYMGERLEEDLRHEATHALLHLAVSDMPLWLDEGLAEYFEGPEERGGLNPEHLSRLPLDRAEGWSPDLTRLEKLKDVRQMTPRDYRESWAWVHYLLNGQGAGKKALLGYLGDLRRSAADARPLSARLDASGGTSPRLLAHLDAIRERPVAVAAPAKDQTLRLQSSPADPNPRRRGLLGWFHNLFRPKPAKEDVE